MAKTKITQGSFSRDLEKLGQQAAALTDANQRLAAAYITYAKQLTLVWKTAKQLDKGSGKQTHKDDVLKLGGIGGTRLDSTTISKWRKIAFYADTLSEHSNRLPSGRDPLFYVAGLLDKKVSIKRAILSNEISPISKVSDLKSLAPTASKKSKGGRKPKATETKKDGVPMPKIQLGIVATKLPRDAQAYLDKSGCLWLKIVAENVGDDVSTQLVATEYTKA